MTSVRCLSLALVAGLLAAAPICAQSATGIVTGRVLDSASRQPLSSVSIRIVGTANGSLTKGDGTFTIGVVGAGTQKIRASRIGFAAQTRDVTVNAGGSVSVELVLAPQAAVLSDIVATVAGTSSFGT